MSNGDEALEWYRVASADDLPAGRVMTVTAGTHSMALTNVATVFGMVGHSNLGLADALRLQEKNGRLRFFGVRHEGAAAFACSGYAKLTGKPAACLTIAGPGATNLMTGLWDAKVDRAPVLALTGQVDVQVLGPPRSHGARKVSQRDGAGVGGHCRHGALHGGRACRLRPQRRSASRAAGAVVHLARREAQPHRR